MPNILENRNPYSICLRKGIWFYARLCIPGLVRHFFCEIFHNSAVLSFPALLLHRSTCVKPYARGRPHAYTHHESLTTQFTNIQSSVVINFLHAFIIIHIHLNLDMRSFTGIYLQPHSLTFTFLHLTSIMFILDHLPWFTFTDLNTPSFTLIYSHLPLFAFIELHLLSSTFIYLHLPSFLFIYLHLCSSTFIYVQRLSSTLIYLNLPSFTLIYLYLHSFTSVYIHLPSSTLIYVHLPSFVFIYLHLNSFTFIYLHLP